MSRSIEISSEGESVILWDGLYIMPISSPDDATALILALTDLLKTHYPTVWATTSESRYKRKVDEMNIFLSMCKAVVKTSEMKKVME